jgi:hypothetical protein
MWRNLGSDEVGQDFPAPLAEDKPQEYENNID